MLLTKRAFISNPSFQLILCALLIFLFNNELSAQSYNPKSNQWKSVGGEMLLSGNHEFNESWTSTAASREKGLYWQGGFYDKEEDRNYQPWENTVKNSVAPVLGKFTVVGPGTIGLYQRTKGARIVLTDISNNTSFITWNGGSISWNRDSWSGSVKEYPATGFPFWGQVGAGQEITLEVTANMTPYNNAINTGEYAFRAPQEITEYEVWFFPREGGKIIDVTSVNQTSNQGVGALANALNSAGTDVFSAGEVISGTLNNDKDGYSISQGQKIPEGQKFQNSTDKPVRIKDNDGHRYTIEPGTTFYFKPKEAQAKTNTVFLIAGRLWTLTNPNSGKKYAVETYNSVAGCTDDFEGEQQVYKPMQEYYAKRYQQAMQKMKNKERSTGNLNETVSFDLEYDEKLRTTTIEVMEGTATFACKNNGMDPVLVDAGNVASFDNKCTPILNGVVLSGNSIADANALSPIADSHVYAYSYSKWNKANWGKYEMLGAGWNPTGGEKRAYLKFDVSGIAKSSFEKATLKLFHYHSAGSDRAELGVFTVRNPWNEGNGTYKPQTLAGANEICWENQPFSDQYPVAYFNPGMQTNDFVEVDITPLVKSWLEGMPNHGLAIKAGENYVSGSESMYGFYSREHEDADKRPQLIISGGQSIVSKNSSQADFFEDFSSGMENFTADDPNAKITDGKLNWYTGESGKTSFNWNIPIENIAIEFDGFTDSNGFGIHWLNNENLGYSATIGGWFNTKSGSHFGAEGQNIELVGGAVFTVNNWHHYKIVRKGDELSAYCDDKLIFFRTITQKFEGPAKLWFSSWRANFRIDNVKVYKLETDNSSESNFYEDFSGPMVNYIVDDANAKITDGKLYWDTGLSGKTTFKWNIPMENVSIEFDGYTENNGFGVHWLNAEKLGYSATFGGWFNTKSGSHFGAEGQNLELVDGKVFTVKKWHHYKIIRKGDELAGYCDGNLVFKRTINQKYNGPANLWFSSWRANFGLDNVKVSKLN